MQGVDYDETLSPVAMLKFVRILLAIAAYFDYEIWQMDVKTMFLNINLEENVYMIQPEGFMAPEDAGKVCKLKRSIYGLSRLHGVGIFALMKWSRVLVSSKMAKKLVFTRK